MASIGLSDGLVASLHLGLLGRLLLAAFLGGIIGLERELSGKPAGLRTNLLICVGATLLMEVSINLSVSANLGSGEMRSDPARIAAQIVSGIGFLGAGTIIQARGSIIGLTTAATIWVVAAIGMAVGGRFYVEAIGSTILVGTALVMLGRVEGIIIRRRHAQRYLFALDPDPDLLSFISDTFREAGLRVETESVEKSHEQYQATFDVDGQARLHRRVVDSLISHTGVRKMTRIF
ncbi:MAG: MgtC/SapB family protein [Gemmatimonadetes bacterium]|nr:MgtC/SapB family protein [Gemmatimonadota bacterium]